MKNPFLSPSDSEWNLIENLMNWKPPLESTTPRPAKAIQAIFAKLGILSFLY